MKAIIYVDGEVKVFDMVSDEGVYFQGDDMHPGYKLKDEDDFIPGGKGEYLSFSLAMGMYEGAEAAGSYVDYMGEDDEPCKFEWSWALLPENNEETEHLRLHCPRTLYRAVDGTAGDGKPSEPGDAIPSWRHTQLKRVFIDKNLPEDFLDDAVHDLASMIGSETNNNGVDAQLLFIKQQMGFDGALRYLENIKKPEGHDG